MRGTNTYPGQCKLTTQSMDVLFGILEASDTDTDLTLKSGLVHPGGGNFPAVAHASTLTCSAPSSLTYQT